MKLRKGRRRPSRAAVLPSITFFRNCFQGIFNGTIKEIYRKYNHKKFTLTQSLVKHVFLIPSRSFLGRSQVTIIQNFKYHARIL